MPSNPPSISVGERLYALGYRTTVWLDINTHQEVRGVFDPTKTDRLGRYGAPNAIFGWPSRNYTGGHAAGGNQRAEGLAPQVFNTPPDPHTLEDLDFVDGATQFVLREAAAQNLHTIDDGPSGPPEVPDPSSVIADLQAQLAAAKAETADLSEKYFAATTQLNKVRALASSQLSALPATGGGRPVSGARAAFRNILIVVSG